MNEPRQAAIARWNLFVSPLTLSSVAEPSWPSGFRRGGGRLDSPTARASISHRLNQYIHGRPSIQTLLSTNRRSPVTNWTAVVNFPDSKHQVDCLIRASWGDRAGVSPF